MGLIAVVWHYWIAPILVGLALLAVLAAILGYLSAVTPHPLPEGLT